MKKKHTLLAVAAAAIIIISISIFIAVKNKNNDTETTAHIGYSDSEAVLNNIDTGITVIDESCIYQTMKGFGCSAYPWAGVVGGIENPSDIISLLYSPTDGIGLNIYRYNLGAGSKEDTAIKDPLKRTESFLSDDGTYDFSKDANAQSCLAAAKNMAGDDLRVVLFANSPPVQLTKNGLSYSSAPASPSEPYSSNLDPENYSAYANYLYECSEHFINSGYRITEISPVNEPRYSHRATVNGDGTISASEEGCFYLPEEITALYGELVSVFNATSVADSGVKFILPECGEAEGEGSATAAYVDSLLSSDIYKSGSSMTSNSVSIHSYWSSAEKKQQFSDFLQVSFPYIGISCTEYTQLTNDGNNGILEYLISSEDNQKGLTVEYALAMANIIMTDLTVLNAEEWCWGTGISASDSPDGLIYFDPEDPTKTEISKRLWVLGNFSKFIKEGAVRLAASSGNSALPCVAFRNSDGSFVCVYLNSTEFDITTDMSAFLPDAYSVYITDESNNLKNTDLISDGILTVPARSIVSVVY